MYVIAACTSMFQLRKVVARVTKKAYPGCKASTKFGLGIFRKAFKEWISPQLTENREPALSLGCPHPSRRNQVPMGDNATAAFILSMVVTDMGVTSAQN